MDAINEAELAALNPYTGGDEPLPSYRAIVRQRKADWLKEHPLPDPLVDPIGWDSRMGKRIATVCKDKGIINNSQINLIRDAVLAEARLKQTYERGIWLILKRIITPRIKLNKALQDMKSVGRHKYIEVMFYDAGLLDITHMKEWRNYVEQFPANDQAYKWAESFIRNNHGNDIETVTRSMKAYAIPVPPPLTPEQLAKHVDPNLAKMTDAERRCQSCGGREVLGKTWYCPKCNSREESAIINPVQQSELDKFMPRCKAHNEPADELTGLCDTCVAEKQKKHFCQLPGFYGKVAARFSKNKQAAIIPNYIEALHEWFEVTTLKDIEMDEEPFFNMVDFEISVRFKVAPQSNGEADFSDVTDTGLMPHENEDEPIVPTSTQSIGQEKELNAMDNITEMPFVVLFDLFTQGGMQMKYTVRAMTEDELIERSEALIKKLLSKGYTTGRPASAQSASNGNGQAAAQDSSGGKSTCVMIKIDASYEGKKPQLQFECDGMDTPLKFTKAPSEMVKLLSNVRKLDGTPFTDNDMQIGRKFPGQWAVVWDTNEKDGKTYKNVKAVQAA